jgi:hypothetical protein
VANHAQQLAAAEFFVVPTATCRLLFVLVILAHERRRVVHIAVTDHPTQPRGRAQQLREAFPWNAAPRYVVHDRDAAFCAWTTTAAAMGIEEILTAPRSRSKQLFRNFALTNRGVEANLFFRKTK